MRLIIDNIVVVHELLHTMKNTKKGKKGKMTVKPDISKENDKVEWSYIEAILKALGFKDQWIQLVMSCITTVSYFVLVNDKPSETFLPSRGLQQGDPLSPHLLLMCVERFNSFINDSKRKGEIHRLSLEVVYL